MRPPQRMTVSDGFYGARLGAHLAMEHRHLLSISRDDGLELAVTRLSCGRDLRDRTAPTPTEAAFSLLHQLQDLDGHACWQGGRQRFAGPFGTGTVSLVDLREQAACEFRGPVEAVQFYVPKATLDALAYQQGARPLETLVWDRARPDPVLVSMTQLLLSELEQREAANRLLVDHLGLGLLAHFSNAYGRVRPTGQHSGGLAPWQMRRAEDMLRARLASQLTIADVAKECRLTPSHFARAFRRSLGVAPHQYLTNIRVVRSKELMTTTDLPLADIALLSGFGDQSYFTRIFTRTIGTSPGAWRRARTDVQLCPRDPSDGSARRHDVEAVLAIRQQGPEGGTES